MNNKYSLAEWRKHCAEFRQYGYDPYDSEALREWCYYQEYIAC